MCADSRVGSRLCVEPQRRRDRAQLVGEAIQRQVMRAQQRKNLTKVSGAASNALQLLLENLWTRLSKDAVSSRTVPPPSSWLMAIRAPGIELGATVLRAPRTSRATDAAPGSPSGFPDRLPTRSGDQYLCLFRVPRSLRSLGTYVQGGCARTRTPVRWRADRTSLAGVPAPCECHWRADGTVPCRAP